MAPSFNQALYQKMTLFPYHRIRPLGTNCAPLIAESFLYCKEREFMSNLQKSKRFDLINKFNDTCRYLDDIFTIDNPTLAEHIPDIYI